MALNDYFTQSETLLQEHDGVHCRQCRKPPGHHSLSYTWPNLQPYETKDLETVLSTVLRSSQPQLNQENSSLRFYSMKLTFKDIFPYHSYFISLIVFRIFNKVFKVNNVNFPFCIPQFNRVFISFVSRLYFQI